MSTPQPVHWVRKMTHQEWTIKVYNILAIPPGVVTTAEDNAYVAIKAIRNNPATRDALLIVHQGMETHACIFVYWNDNRRPMHQGWSWTGTRWVAAPPEPLLALPHVRGLIAAEHKTLFPPVPTRWTMHTIQARILQSGLHPTPNRPAFLSFRYSCRQAVA